MLYDSSRNVPFEAFENYSPPPPSVHRPRWKGIPHQHLVNMVRTQARNNGLKIISEQFQLACEGNHRLYASWDFEQDVPGAPGVKMALGYRGDNLSTIANTFAVGGRVLVCQNGIISGEYVMRRKHTKNLNLKQLVVDAFTCYMGKIGQIARMVSKLRSIDLDDQLVDQILLASAREGVIAWSRLHKVDQCWHNPIHADFEPRNAWSLYNAYTEVAKMSPPRTAMPTMAQAGPLIVRMAL